MRDAVGLAEVGVVGEEFGSGVGGVGFAAACGCFCFCVCVSWVGEGLVLRRVNANVPSAMISLHRSAASFSSSNSIACQSNSQKGKHNQNSQKVRPSASASVTLRFHALRSFRDA